MKSRDLLKLVISAAVVFVVYGVLQFSNRNGRTSNERSLSIKWEQVTKITLSKEDKMLDLVANEYGEWSLPARNSYPASSSAIRAFLLKLMDISTSQKVQVSSTGLEKLGLNDSGKHSGLGTITLFYKDKEAGKVYLGALRSRKGESMENEMALTGQYVKYSASDQVFMLPMAVNLKLEPKDWIETALLNVSINDVFEVVSRVLGSEKSQNSQKSLAPDLLLSREDDLFSSNAAKFKAEIDVPKGKEILQTNVNQVATALENFAFTDVLSINDDDFKSAKGDRVIEYRLLTGQVYEIKLARKDQRSFVVISTKIDSGLLNRVNALRSQFESLITAKESKGSPVTKPEDANNEKGASIKKIEFANENEVSEVNKKFQGWVYEVPEYLYDRLSKTGEELLTDANTDVAK